MNDDSIRREIAVLAAQYIADSGFDYRRAKQKAAAELYGAQARHAAVPDNDLIDQALREHLDLFDAPAHRERLQRMRVVALDLMQQLEPFQPYVTGAAWKGIVTEYAVLHLQLFADDPKAVMIDLINRGLDPQPAEQANPPAGSKRAQQPGEAVEFVYHDVPVLISLYSGDALRGQLRSSDNGSAARGTRAQLQALLAPA